MPIKKKTTAAKKPAVLGPKAKLMKLAVTTLRNKAKKLGISDVAKRTKENLVQSIILGEARKKRGTAAGKKATAKKRTMASKNEDRQTGSSDFTTDYARFALPPGRRTTDSGSVYYERRKNRSDSENSFTGYGSRKKKQLAEYDTYKEYVIDQLNKPNWEGSFPVNVRFISDTGDSKAFHVSTRTIPIIIDFLESLLEEQPESIIL